MLISAYLASLIVEIFLETPLNFAVEVFWLGLGFKRQSFIFHTLALPRPLDFG